MEKINLNLKSIDDLLQIDRPIIKKYDNGKLYSKKEAHEQCLIIHSRNIKKYGYSI